MPVKIDLEAALAKSLKAHRGDTPHREFADIVGLIYPRAYRYEFRQLEVKLKFLPEISAGLNSPIEVLLDLPSAKYYDPKRGLWLP